jgi:hypothetical protein
VFRITSAWNETLVTYNTAPTIDPAAWASLVIPDGDVGTYRSWDVSTLVSGWIDGLYPNFGMWIEEIPIQGPAIAYFQASSALPSQLPTLEIDYTANVVSVPEPVTLTSFGAGMVAMWIARRRRKSRSAR